MLQLGRLSGTNDDMLQQLEPLVAGSEKGQQGVARLAELLAAARAAGVPDERLRLDVSIARGLDYYTGHGFRNLPGRLARRSAASAPADATTTWPRSTPTRSCPASARRWVSTGCWRRWKSWGCSPRWRRRPRCSSPISSPAACTDYLRLAAAVRASGVGVEVFPDPKRLGQQLKYADRRGFKIAIIIGEDEFAEGKCQIKDLVSGESRAVLLEDNGESVIQVVLELLGRAEK